MTSRPDAPVPARVVERRVVCEHLVRLRLAHEADTWTSTGLPDEWLALTLPGQFQTRYYTVRAHTPGEVVLDVVVHERGLVTEWAQTDCVGDEVGLGAARGSFDPPADSTWVVLAGDATALPAMARISEHLASSGLVLTAYVEVPDDVRAGYPDGPTGDVCWSAPPGPAASDLADVVAGIAWPEGPGYFWMGGESAQMRRIRAHLRREVGFAPDRYDVMGYWSPDRGTRLRAVDPGPIYARGKAAGKSDAEIWADYDQARDQTSRDQTPRDHTLGEASQ